MPKRIESATGMHPSATLKNLKCDSKLRRTCSERSAGNGRYNLCLLLSLVSCNSLKNEFGRHCINNQKDDTGGGIVSKH